MTTSQKKRIEYMCGKGESYAAIAADLGISTNTVKSYCRRNNLCVGCIAPKSDDTCKNCDKPLEHKPKAKKKRFCSDSCRLAWWKAHPEAVNRRAVYNFICTTCGERFEAYGNAHRKYCSRACFGRARRASL